jgi:hypothetical protein
MSCSPSYSFRPTDRSSPVQSSAPGFVEHRSRLFAGGTFFRSIEQGQDQNDISLEAIITPTDITLNVYVLAVLQETFVVPQVFVIGGPPDFIGSCSGGIPALRAAVNDSITGSNIIEMPVRGFDIFDFGTDPVDDCLSAFSTISMAGGSGPPAGANQAFLDSIFTGTERTLVIIITTEAANGFPITPGADRRVRQWDGTQWIQYANLVQGSCPIDGPPV